MCCAGYNKNTEQALEVEEAEIHEWNSIACIQFVYGMNDDKNKAPIFHGMQSNELRWQHKY